MRVGSPSYRHTGDCPGQRLTTPGTVISFRQTHVFTNNREPALCRVSYSVFKGVRAASIAPAMRSNVV